VRAEQIYIALSGAIPALVAMWLVDRLDRKRPEPPRLRRMVAFVGALSVIPAIIAESFLSGSIGMQLEPEWTYQGASFKSFIVAAGVEEFFKILVIYWIVWHRPEFDERMDGIVYASRAGLGFALVENVMYLLVVAKTMDDQIEMWILRAVLSVPGHAMWTGMIGYMAARRRFDKQGLGLVGGYLLAVAFHGAYDLALFVQQPMALEGLATEAKYLMAVPVALTILAFVVLRAMARTALRLDDAEAASAAARAAAAAVPPSPGYP
jgi:RsiW-degrading membrane proteinase PrsW (M82 family)